MKKTNTTQSLMNHSAIFAPRDLFEKKENAAAKAPTSGTASKKRENKMSKDEMKSGKAKHVKKQGFNLVPGPPLKKEDLLSSKGLEKVVQSIGDGGVEAGNPVGPVEDPHEGVSLPKNPKAPTVLQKGPSRYAQQNKPSGGNGEPGPAVEVTCAMKNLQLQRTQEYLDIESYGVDAPSPPTASDKSGSSTPTYLDTESDFDELDSQTRVECNEMGIDPQALHSDIKELVYVPEDGREMITADDCLRAVNVILADAESLPGTVVTAFRLERGAVIGVLKRPFTSCQIKREYTGPKSATKKPIIKNQLKDDPDCDLAKWKTPASSTSDQMEVVDTPAENKVTDRVVTVIAPKRSGGAPFRFKIPTGLYEECFSTELSKTAIATALLKRMGMYMTYRFTCDYSSLNIEIEHE